MVTLEASAGMGELHQLLNYSKLEDIAKDNKAFLREVTQSYIELLGQFKKDYPSASTASDTKTFQQITHKMKGSLRFMEAHELLAAISKFRSPFYAGTATPEMALASTAEVTEICDRILEFLKEKKIRIG